MIFVDMSVGFDRVWSPAGDMHDSIKKMKAKKSHFSEDTVLHSWSSLCDQWCGFRCWIGLYRFV